MEDTLKPMFVDESKQYGESKKATQYIAAVAASMAAVTAGTILAWTSPTLPQLVPQAVNVSDVVAFANATNATTGDLQLTVDQGSWVGSLLAIGALIGAMPAGMMVERLGRKITILSLAVPFLLSWVLIVFANGAGMLYAGRLFAGIATGGICVTAPLYIGEIAETSIRGALGAFFQLFLTVGILFTFVVGGLTSWRVLSAISAVIPIIFVVTFVFVPETPQFLLAKNKRREAERSLRWLRGDKYNLAPELETMQKEVDNAARHKGSLKDLISSRANVMALVCSLGLMFFQQFSGINAVIFYTEPIFVSAGSNVNSAVAAGIIGIVQTISTCVASLLIEKAGRRILLLQSGIIMGLCLIVLGVYFKLQSISYDVSNIGFIPLVSLVLFIISFSLGFGPIPWMMMAELFPAEIKGVASGIAVMFNWLLVFFVTKTFPSMTASFGSHNTFWIFAGFMVACVIFVFSLIPETKGKTNAQIQEILAGNRN